MVKELLKRALMGFMVGALIGAMIALLGGCSVQTRQTISEFNEQALKTLKDGKFVGHYSFEVGESEAGVKNSVYLNPGFKLSIDGDFNYKDGN